MARITNRAKLFVERIGRIDRHAVDFVLALVFTLAALWTVAERVGGDDVYRSDDFLGVVLLLLQTLPIAARRVAPLTALTVSVAGISLHIALGYEGVPAGTFAALVILYSAASMTETPQALLAALITAVGLVTYFTTDRGNPTVTQAVTTSATYAATWGLGVYIRSRRQYTDLVEERAGLLEREREVQSREAIAAERSRIARELHDMVGHALSLIVIQSGGAQRVLESRPELARDTLASIEATGRQALADMERMLGMLGSTEAESLSPQPGLGEVEVLAARVSEAGLPVKVAVQGTPVPLPSSVDLSAYRIVQEALTNALKHAGPAQVVVNIRYEPDRIELVIVDNGRGVVVGEANDNHQGGGRGLIGMKERVALFGGELEAGPRPEGGFQVHAILPIGGVPA